MRKREGGKEEDREEKGERMKMEKEREKGICIRNMMEKKQEKDHSNSRRKIRVLSYISAADRSSQSIVMYNKGSS